MSARRVTLIGGTGFIGTELAIRLAERFEEVRLPSRRAGRVREMRVLPNVRLIECDVHDAAAVRAVIDGSDVVVNLVGILNQSGAEAGKDSFDGAHVGLTDTVLAACESLGVPRYLHVSALAADAQDGSSEYLRSKGRAEERVRAAPASLAWTIFRPSIVFGRKDKFFNRFAGLLRALPVAFPLAVPEARMAPVWVGDVINMMDAAIDDPSQHGAIVPLCGPQEFTLRELVEYTAKTAGMKRRVIGLSDGLSRLQAKIMQRVPGKPFTMDNYDSLQTPIVCPDGCPRQPTSLDSVVPGYLGGKDAEGRLQDRREFARR